MIQVSAGIVFSNGKILAMKKGKSKFDYLSNKYEFPGGKIEPGEEPLETLKRELSEELKTDIGKGEISHVADISYDYPDFSVMIHSFLIRIAHFDFTMTEHIGYRWLHPQELNDVDWVEADKIIVDKIKGVI